MSGNPGAIATRDPPLGALSALAHGERLGERREADGSGRRVLEAL